MTQDAVVLETFNNGIATVAVTRGTACGSNCDNCEACVYQNQLHVKAINSVNAKRGQKVEIETKSTEIYKAEIVVYIIPLLLLIIGYVIGSLLGLSEGISALIGFVLLIFSVVVIVFTQRKKPDIKFYISRIKYD